MIISRDINLGGLVVSAVSSSAQDWEVSSSIPAATEKLFSVIADLKLFSVVAHGKIKNGPKNSLSCSVHTISLTLGIYEQERTSSDETYIRLRKPCIYHRSSRGFTKVN